MCPMLWCRREFDDIQSTAFHISNCSRLSEGLYWCSQCSRPEKFTGYAKSALTNRHFSNHKRKLSVRKAVAFFKNLGRKLLAKDTKTRPSGWSTKVTHVSFDGTSCFQCQKLKSDVLENTSSNHPATPELSKTRNTVSSWVNEKADYPGYHYNLSDVTSQSLEELPSPVQIGRVPELQGSFDIPKFVSPSPVWSKGVREMRGIVDFSKFIRRNELPTPGCYLTSELPAYATRVGSSFSSRPYSERMTSVQGSAGSARSATLDTSAPLYPELFFKEIKPNDTPLRRSSVCALDSRISPRSSYMCGSAMGLIPHQLSERKLVEELRNLFYIVKREWGDKIMLKSESMSRDPRFDSPVLFEMSLKVLRRFFKGRIPASFKDVLALMFISCAIAYTFHSEEDSCFWDTFFQDMGHWRHNIHDTGDKANFETLVGSLSYPEEPSDTPIPPNLVPLFDLLGNGCIIRECSTFLKGDSNPI